jgi:hypothetical protein
MRVHQRGHFGVDHLDLLFLGDAPQQIPQLQPVVRRGLGRFRDLREVVADLLLGHAPAGVLLDHLVDDPVRLVMGLGLRHVERRALQQGLDHLVAAARTLLPLGFVLQQVAERLPQLRLVLHMQGLEQLLVHRRLGLRADLLHRRREHPRLAPELLDGRLAVSELFYRLYFLKKLPEANVKAEDAKSVSWIQVQISDDKDKLRKKLISFGLLTVISFVFIIIAGYEGEYLFTMAAFQAYLFFYTGVLIYGLYKKK